MPGIQLNYRGLHQMIRTMSRAIGACLVCMLPLQACAKNEVAAETSQATPGRVSHQASVNSNEIYLTGTFEYFLSIDDGGFMLKPDIASEKKIDPRNNRGPLYLKGYEGLLKPLELPSYNDWNSIFQSGDRDVAYCGMKGVVTIAVTNVRVVPATDMRLEHTEAKLISIKSMKVEKKGAPIEYCRDSEDKPVYVSSAGRANKGSTMNISEVLNLARKLQRTSTPQTTTNFPTNLSIYTSIFPEEGGKDIISNKFVKERLQSMVPTKWSSRVIKPVWNESGIEQQGSWTHFSMCKPSACGDLSFEVFLNSQEKTMTVFTTDMSSLSVDQVLALQKQGKPNLGFKYITCKTTSHGIETIPNKLLDVMLEGNYLVDYNYRDSGRASADLKATGCSHVD